MLQRAKCTYAAAIGGRRNAQAGFFSCGAAPAALDTRPVHTFSKNMSELLHVLLLEPRLAVGQRLGARLRDSTAVKTLVIECPSLVDAETELERSLVDLIVVDASALDVDLAVAITRLKMHAPSTALVALSDDDDDAVTASRQAPKTGCHAQACPTPP